jgi:hypothetical protein
VLFAITAVLLGQFSGHDVVVRPCVAPGARPEVPSVIDERLAYQLRTDGLTVVPEGDPAAEAIVVCSVSKLDESLEVHLSLVDAKTQQLISETWLSSPTESGAVEQLHATVTRLLGGEAMPPVKRRESQLHLRVDAEGVGMSERDDYANFRGEGLGLFVAATSNRGGLRFGVFSRVSRLATAVNGDYPMAFDLAAITGYRLALGRYGFEIEPQVGLGAELFTNGADWVFGLLIEAALQLVFKLTEVWSIALRFSFTPTPMFEAADGPRAWWRVGIGVEWNNPG